MQGFSTQDQLVLIIQRRTSAAPAPHHAKPLGSLTLNETIIDRHYQQRAVRKVAEAFEKKERPASRGRRAL